jgi:hypothetical protein
MFVTDRVYTQLLFAGAIADSFVATGLLLLLLLLLLRV